MKKYLLFLVCVSMIIFASCSRQKSKKETIKTVRTETVKSYNEKQSVTFPGKIKAASEVNLSFRVSGPIAKIYVDEGSYVKQGQLLAEIDSRDYEIQLSATEAEYNQIKGEAERVIKLYEKESVTPNAHEKAVYGLQQITAKYNAHKNALEDTKLYAPFDGYIQKRFFDKNETVSAGMPVISMINTGIPEIEINIPSSDFIKRNDFESYSCVIDIFPDKIFQLDLIGINQKANLNQLYSMRLRFKNTNSNSLPTPGMTTMVTINYKTKESEYVAIPVSSIFEYEGKTSVWIYDNNTSSVKMRNIKPYEILTNGNIVVSEGLKAGETVISAGVHSLQNDEKVKLLPPVSSTNIGGML